MDLPDIYRVFQPAAAQYTISVAYEIFSKIDYILGHKSSLNKYKKVEITLCILSNHNRIKLALNNKRRYRKYSNTQRLKNMLLNDQWVTEEIRGGKLKSS
jgi:hypothetical protein